MAISREKKAAQVDQLERLLSGSRMTVTAAYAGLSVAQLQQLRRQASQEGVTIKIVKNRLVKVAMKRSEVFKQSDSSSLQGQLLYAFAGSDDETAAARALHAFAKNNEALHLHGGFDDTGRALDAAILRAVAELPGKEALRGTLAGTFMAPLSGLASVVNANLRSLMHVLSARAQEQQQ